MNELHTPEKKPEIPVFAIGDRLVTARGATAVVKAIEKDLNDKHKTIGYRVELTEPGKAMRSVLLQNGALVGWHLGTATVVSTPAEQPEIAALESETTDALKREIARLQDEV